MRLYKRDRSPYWWCEFTVGGTQYRMSTKRSLNDQAGAKRFLATEYDKMMNVVQFGQKPEITLREAMERTVRSVEGQTKRSYELNLRRWLGDAPFTDKKAHWSLKGSMLLSKLTQHHLEDHLEYRRDEGKAVNTIIIEARFIQRVCNLMAKRYAVNPDLEFKKPKPFKKTRWLTEDEAAEVSALLLAKRGSPSYDKAYDFFVFQMDTGARLEEALSLSWQAVDLPRGVVQLYRGKTSNLSMDPLSDRVLDIC